MDFTKLTYKVGDVVTCSVKGCISSDSTEPYPWDEYDNDYKVYRKGKVPCRILQEYPLFYVVEVMSHIHPVVNFGESKPYTVTIDKRDILAGNMIISSR